MNEFKFLLEKNIDHNIAHDHYIYEEFFLCILKKKFMNDRPFLILNLHSQQSWISQILSMKYIKLVRNGSNGDLSNWSKKDNSWLLFAQDNDCS